jgi:hypothetical protein
METIQANFYWDLWHKEMFVPRQRAILDGKLTIEKKLYKEYTKKGIA